MIGYKIAHINSKRVLVTLDIPNDAKTNSNRSNILDIKHAKYRCNKCKVIKINDLDGNEYNEAYSLYYNQNFKYILNEEIIIDNYKDNEEVCREGIHYFIDKITALTYRLVDIVYIVKDNKFQLQAENKLKDGEYIDYNHDGSFKNICQFKNNMFNGEYKSYLDEKRLIIYNIKDNIFDGVSKHYNNGELSKEIIFENGIKLSKKYYNSI